MENLFPGANTKITMNGFRKKLPKTRELEQDGAVQKNLSGRGWYLSIKRLMEKWAETYNKLTGKTVTLQQDNEIGDR
ncbi:MAG: hypothetical protein IJN50_04430 [Clostridia bacterium]|nr:hypothetical protein [Clostridia bacterium]